MIPALLLVVTLVVGVPAATAQVSQFVRPMDRPELEKMAFLSSPTARVRSTTRAAAFEAPNVLLIEQEKACARSDRPGAEVLLVVEGQKTLPAYATAATVFLNGWELRYPSQEHYIAQMSTGIGNIRKEGNTLKWLAFGHIRDKNFDDAYEWCYHYVTVAWNQAVLDAYPQDDAPSLSLAFSAQRVNEETALVTAAGFKGDLLFRGMNVVTALPEGFYFDWGGENFEEAFPKLDDIDQGEDRHLLQVAYSMGPSTLFLEFGKSYDTVFAPALPTDASRVDDGFVSWETQAIFKDNEAKRKFLFMDKFSALAGNGIGVIHAPFTVRPVEDTGASTGCITTPARVKTTEHVIENIPFQYAWPVLSGWDLNFDCQDAQVAEIGIWLHDISYTAGVMRYKVSSILRNKGNDKSFGARHGVLILGFNSTVAPTPRPSL